MSDDVKRDLIGPWSCQKLKMLESYLAAYVNILSAPKLKSYCSHFHYIDAFAGAVDHIDRITNDYVEGSPRVALNVQPSFSSYTFIEKNSKRYRKVIEPLTREYPHHRIISYNGDCNEILLKEVLPTFPKRKPQNNKLGFIFLDPYGMNLDWHTVKAIGEAGVFDVFINLSIMAVIRQAPGVPPPVDVQEQITRFMGTPSWFTECYMKKGQCALPGITVDPFQRRQDNKVAERLASCYQKQLKNCFRFTSTFRIMRGSKNQPIYALIFASQSELAVRKMNAIIKSQADIH